MIVGRHPYVVGECADDKEFIDLLRVGVLRVPAGVRARMSMPMQHLFELVLGMLAKKDGERLDFGEILQFVRDEEAFLKFAESPTHRMES